MKENSVSFIQLPFSVFVAQFPEVLGMFPPAALKEFLSDKNYIVRFDGDKLEIGYSEDEWTIS